MSSLLGRSRIVLLVFFLAVVVLAPTVLSLEIHSPMDPFEMYYREYFGDNSYIVYRGMSVNITDSFRYSFVVPENTSIGVAARLVPSRLFRVVDRDLDYSISRTGNKTVMEASVFFRAVIDDETRFGEYRVGVEWLVFTNSSISYNTTHYLGYPLKVMVRDVNESYLVVFVDEGFDETGAYRVFNVFVFNLGLGYPFPDKKYWGDMAPPRPGMFLIYNLSVTVCVFPGRICGSNSTDVLPANRSIYVSGLKLPVDVSPSRIVVWIHCCDDVHGCVNIMKSINYQWDLAPVNIVSDRKIKVKISDGVGWSKEVETNATVKLRIGRLYFFSSKSCSLSKFITGPTTVFIPCTSRARTYTYTIPRGQGYTVSLEYALIISFIVAVLVLIIVILLEKMIHETNYFV